METNTAKVTVRVAGTGVCVLDLEGALDALAENALMDAHAQATREEARTILLNFAGLESMDGTGLSLLVIFCSWAARREQRVGAFGVSPRCRRVMEDLGLHTAMDFHASEARALASAGLEPGAEEPVASPSEEQRVEACPAEHWVGKLDAAQLPSAPEGFRAVNVEGRKALGPMGGFGQLWHKVYRVRLSGVSVTPDEVIRLCKEQLGEFWPKGNRLYVPPPGIVPGAVGLIDLTLPGGAPLSTGIRVLYVGDRSFTFVTLSGHLEAGWITFSAYEDSGSSVVQVASLARTGDPMYELGFVLFGHSEQEKFWRTTLENLAKHYEVPANVEVRKTCVDAARHWEGVGNLWHNAAARTAASTVGSLLARAFRSPRRP